jgi:hypothetical protein
MRTAFFTALVFALLTVSASAHARHHHYRHYAHRHHITVAADTPWAGWGFWGEQQPSAVSLTRRHFSDGRPRAWCGWYMRQVKGVADASYNLARNWIHFGHASGPVVGAVAVWPHHVGEVAEGSCPAGQIMLHSGNDGHAVRTRCVSLHGLLAFRD